MFNTNNIYTNNTGRFLCNHNCDSERTAKYLVACHLMRVREHDFFANLYNKGSVLILDSPDFNSTKNLAKMLNKIL